MSTPHRSSFLLLVSAALAPSLAFGAPQTQCPKRIASEGAEGDHLGYSVGLEGNRLVAGAPGDDDAATDAGSVYVFDSCMGTELLEWTASDALAGDGLGSSVAIHGNVAVVGAVGHDHFGLEAGVAYVFDVATGQQLLELSASDAAQADYFGFSVALDDQRIVVGAARKGVQFSQQGAVYVFDRATGQELHRLTASNAAQGTFFGWTVGIDGDRIVVGSRFNDTAYVFDATTGQELLQLRTNDPNRSPFFGEEVAISGRLALVGDWDDDELGTHAGAAYLFDVSTGAELHRLTAHDGGPNELFGESVALRGDYAVVGARGVGAAYVFDSRSGAPLFVLEPEDGVSDGFARSVAVSGERIAAGAWRENGAAGFDVGAAYVYRVETTIGTNYCGPANLNSTGFSAVAFAFGDLDVAQNFFAVKAAHLPPHRFGYFLASRTTGFVPFAGGSQGNLCLGGTIGRFRDQVQTSGAAGSFAISVDLTDVPPDSRVVQAGESWSFQAWFRDSNPGSTSNFTDGVTVVFE